MAEKSKKAIDKRVACVSTRQKELQKAIEKSSFVFGKAEGVFVPVYGPFAWVPEPERCTMHAAGSACLEKF